LQWITDFCRIADDQPCVLVTLVIVSGSAPRESGSRMIVTADELLGSVGGGNLEYRATAMARELLETATNGFQVKKLYGLGPELNQCCGGAVALCYEVHTSGAPGWAVRAEAALAFGDQAVLVSALDGSLARKAVLTGASGSRGGLPGAVLEVADDLLRQRVHLAGGVEVRTEQGNWWLERIRHSTRPLMLFGAGHVGQAVARALAPLPFDVTWLDSREAVFPDDTPAHIRTERSSDPAGQVAGARPGSLFVVMTHSHQLDEDICFEVLRRDDFAWLGLIGSDTKRRRFVHRLEKRGIPAARLAALVCPVGIAGIRGKQPATIALSLAAQLMTQFEEG
jgi:xanthine dehydrogenase accessory factor